MNGFERRLTRLEAASDLTARMMVFIHLVPAERASPITATAHGREWRRQPHELEEAFLTRVAAEARLARSGNDVLVAFLE